MIPRWSDEQRRALVDGFLVLRLRSTGRVPTTTDNWAEVVQDELDPQADAITQQLHLPDEGLWLHVAVHYLSPYCPTFQVPS